MIVASEIIETINEKIDETTRFHIKIPDINKKNNEKINMGKFISNVCLLLCIGIGTIGLTSYLFAKQLIKYIENKNLAYILLMLLITIILFIFSYFIINIGLNYSIQNDYFTLALICYVINAMIIGILSSPIAIYGILHDFKDIILAFIISIVFFILLGLFALNTGANFELLTTIIILGIILTTLLLLVKIIAIFIAPKFAQKIDLMSCGVGLVISFTMTIYTVQKLKILAQSTNNKNQSFNTLSVGGASLLLNTFISIFFDIFIILRNIKNNE